MNKKKVLGLLLILLALLFPLQTSILDAEGVSNVKGLISFVGLLIGLFAGYFLIDSADSKAAQDNSHGH